MSTEFDDEMLVAYLDGELSEAEAAQFETKLKERSDLRDRLDQLRNTWDLLDELPFTPPSERFAASTIEMIAVSSTEQTADWRTWLSHNSRWLLVLSIPLLFVVGFASEKISQRAEQKQLLKDLPILVDWRAISNIDSLDWLEVLAEEPQLTSVVDENELHLVSGGRLPVELHERRTWLQTLNDNDRSRLNNNRTELVKRTEQQRSQMREIANHIYSSQEREELLKAIRAYESLLLDKGLTERASLLDMSVESRKDELTKMVNWRLVPIHARKLSTQDISAIQSWAESMQEKYLDLLPIYSDPLFSVLQSFYQSPRFKPIIGSEDFAELASQLSTESQAILAAFSRDEAKKTEAMLYWISELTSPTESDSIQPETLKKFYLSLPDSKRDVIDLLPPEEARYQLQHELEQSAPRGNGA